MKTASHVLMVRPAAFGYNQQTAVNNRFQVNQSGIHISDMARQESDHFINELRKNHISVTVIDDVAEPHTPDSVFPNNWISFHDAGWITYPMFAENRRWEKSLLLPAVKAAFPQKKCLYDLSSAESKGQFLEGTGSLVLDRHNRIAYACRSARTHDGLFFDWCEKMQYRGFLFDAFDQNHEPIYHTNVLLSVGRKMAVVCLECIPQEQRKELEIVLSGSGHQIMDITMQQMTSFAGNMLELMNNEGRFFWVMSDQAFDSLLPEQINLLQSESSILHVPLTVIETAGGGSARCMLAEVF